MLVVYDTILSAIHNIFEHLLVLCLVVYDTILSAIHNSIKATAFITNVVYDTILSAIHNIAAKLRTSKWLYMIRICQHVKERWCKDKD